MATTYGELSIKALEFVPNWLRNVKLCTSSSTTGKSNSDTKVAIDHDETDSTEEHSNLSTSEPEEELSPLHQPSSNPYQCSVQQLLRWRGATEVKHPIDVAYATILIEVPSTKADSCCVQSAEHGSHRKFSSSATSWIAQQRARQVKNTADDEGFTSDTEIAREVKSILNKLTIEKFDKLYTKLTECRISTPAHEQILISEIFEKATTQHHFINMYADLCSRLNDFFSETVKPDKPQHGFKRLLLSQCQAAFEKNLVPPALDSLLDRDERTVAEVRYKTKMLGNIRLVGALVSRNMLSTKVLYAILEEMLGDPTPQSLEAVSVLLTTTGPALDVPDSPCRPAFDMFFARIRVLVEHGSCEARIQCLLKDALDLRASGWHTKRPQRLEAPSALGRTEHTNFEKGVWSNSQQNATAFQAPSRKHAQHRQQMNIAEGFPAQEQEASSAVGVSQVPQPADENTPNYVHIVMPTKMESDRIVDGKLPRAAIAKKVATPPPNATCPARGGDCKVELQKSLAEARCSHEVGEVSNCLLKAGVPSVQAQPKLLHDLLACVSEEGNSFLRKAGFEAVFALYVHDHWKPDSLREGITLFLRGIPDLICDVPNLVHVIREELHPAMKPLVKKGILPSAAYNALAMKI